MCSADTVSMKKKGGGRPRATENVKQEKETLFMATSIDKRYKFKPQLKKCLFESYFLRQQHVIDPPPCLEGKANLTKTKGNDVSQGCSEREIIDHLRC